MARIGGDKGRTWRHRTPWRLTAEETGGVRPRDAELRGYGWLARLTGGMRRRIRYGWRQLTADVRPPAVPAAIHWLAAQGRCGGLPAAAGDRRICPGLTAAALPTLLAYGQSDLARLWAMRLLATQLDSGAFAAADVLRASLVNTAQAIDGLSLLADELPAATSAAERACNYLASCIDRNGRIVTDNLGSGAFERWAAPSFLLTCLPPLAAAARRCEQPAWQAAVDRALERARRSCDLTHWSGALAQFAATADSLLSLGCRDLAAEAMQWPAALQRRDGSVSYTPSDAWTSSEALARAAGVWYKLNEVEPADRAMACLRRRQQPDGGFPSRFGRRADCRRDDQSTWAAKYFLDAAQLQVRSAFCGSRQQLPAEIGLHDGRLAAVCLWMNELDAKASIADVGCGPGRYLRQLAPRFPAARFCGIDVSPQCLAQLPADIEPRRGGLLRLPAIDGEFDGALAVETLEHSLLPQHAVREVCRVVRRGGRVLIIDKNIAKQPLSEHEPWEQWFSPGEVGAWLAEHCEQVSVREVAHGDHREPTGLFLCWQGRRKE